MPPKGIWKLPNGQDISKMRRQSGKLSSAMMLASNPEKSKPDHAQMKNFLRSKKSR